jgi:hypothetical protein
MCKTVLSIRAVAAILFVVGSSPTIAQVSGAGEGQMDETFCYQKTTDHSTHRSAIYFTNLFLIKKSEELRLLGQIASRIGREVAVRSRGTGMTAEKPVCSFVRTESASRDLEETVGVYRRDPSVTIGRLTWERTPEWLPN